MEGLERTRETAECEQGETEKGRERGRRKREGKGRRKLGPQFCMPKLTTF
jgi:hypothetical protein